MDGLVIDADKDMIEFEFGQPILEFRSIGKIEDLFQGGRKSQFFLIACA